MMKWSTAAAAGKEKKYKVTVKPLKLEGITIPSSSASSPMVVLKVKWEGPKSAGRRLGGGLMTMMRPQLQSNYSTHKFLRRRRRSSTDDDSGESSSAAAEVEWDGEEFESVCSFGTDSPWDVTFGVLYGKEAEFRNTKLTTAGSVSLNIAELLASHSHTTSTSHVISLPISLHFHGTIRCQSFLSVSVTFAEVTSADKIPHHQPVSLPSAKDQVAKQTTPYDLSLTTLQKKRRRSFGLSWKTRQHPHPSPPPPAQHFVAGGDGNWEAKELMSRDGGAKLVNANVFHASFDQRSEKAAGESACAAVVSVIAHWLHSNTQSSIPTKTQFDGLIEEGSSEWRKLCHDEAHRSSFPDNHFDLDTVLANLRRPLTLSPNNSFTGIFSPEKFHNLKGATSFDEVWRHVSNSATKVSGQHEEVAVYIVSWNDHFFLFKAESDAYYIIDSLGERLYEGCDRAYVLKFDESTVMYEKAAAEEEEDEGWKVVCEGKECCGEYMKRFLAAVAVGELEAEEKKGNNNEVSMMSLLRRLQIDFHFCCLSTSGISSSPSSVESPSPPASSIFSGDEAQFGE